MSRKKAKKRQKKKPAVAAKQSAEAKVKRMNEAAPTANAKVIRDLMIAQNIRGNFKDYVVIAGKRLVDWQGSYDLVREEDGATVGVNGMALIHKSKLGNVVGLELARNFWRPGIGRVSNAKSGGASATKQG